jgi:hypothetical protein
VKLIALHLAVCLIGMPSLRAADSLEAGFTKPPEETKPWVYWYWLDNNVSRDGITRDLEAMSRVGIGAALIGNIIQQPDHQMHVGTVKVLSAEWWGMIGHAIREGGRLGVDIGLFNCPGWSQAGGPWNTESQSMRSVTTTETRVEGPQRFSGKLPLPPGYFKDIAVLAFPAPSHDNERLSNHLPRLVSVPATEGLGSLIDNNLGTGLDFPAHAARSQPFVLDITLERPITARSLTLHPSAGKHFQVNVVLEAGNSAESLRPVESFVMDRTNPLGPLGSGPLAMSFAPASARMFRLTFTGLTAAGGLAEINLSAAARVEKFIEKQLGRMHPTPLPMWGDYLWRDSPLAKETELAVPSGNVLDVSKNLAADGTFTWDVPPGSWVIMRTGMVPTGARNSPAGEGSGLEVDKMSRSALKSHFDAYIGQPLQSIPAAERKAFKYVVADSWEQGPQNWTDGFDKEFKARYGYDPLPWLPVLTGRMVGSAERSDRFLWDLRRLVADRVASDYVGGFRDLCEEQGLQLWLENYGHWGFPADFLQFGGASHHIGGEFWWETGALGDIECRGAASAAHTYGFPRISAEAFTCNFSNFSAHPYALKRRGDWALTEGINHYVLHVYIHQPWEDRVPGMTAWFGTEFNRHNTWFDAGKAWIDSTRRTHFLLQQGNHVADVAYFTGEDAPKMTGIKNPPLPPGYSFDYINGEAIEKRMEVRDGRFVLPDGTSYRVLVLPELPTMRPALLRKLRDLVAAGGVILGPRPLRSPSLENHPACDEEVASLAATLWGDMKGTARRDFGKGRVYQGHDLAAVLSDIGVTEDVRGLEETKVLWIHRRTKDADIYFLSNQHVESVGITPEFRVEDRLPELWNPETGNMDLLGRVEKTAHGVRVPLTLAAGDSALLVFRSGAEKQALITRVTRDGEPSNVSVSRNGKQLVARISEPGEYRFENVAGVETLRVADVPAPQEIAGPWTVAFPQGMDVPEELGLEKLISLSEHSNQAVKYFSGKAVYKTNFELSPAQLAEQSELTLDLGNVGMMAEVVLNGQSLGSVWKPPFTIAMAGAAKAGNNKLEIRVTTTWHNRLVGDVKYPAGFPGVPLDPKRFKTWCSKNSERIKANTPLQPTGLIGPVRVISAVRARLGGQ